MFYFKNSVAQLVCAFGLGLSTNALAQEAQNEVFKHLPSTAVTSARDVGVTCLKPKKFKLAKDDCVVYWVTVGSRGVLAYVAKLIGLDGEGRWVVQSVRSDNTPESDPYVITAPDFSDKKTDFYAQLRRIHGVYQEWSHDAPNQIEEQSFYVNGLQEGRSRRWKEGKLFWDRNYKNGKEHGLYRTWWWTPEHMSEEGMYENGAKVGLWQEWFEDGTIQSKGNYVNGLKDGEWEENHQVVRSKGPVGCVDAAKVVTSSTVFCDGDFKAVLSSTQKGVYKEGVRDGVWNYFDADAKVDAEQVFNMGSTEKKYPDGSLKSKTDYDLVTQVYHVREWFKNGQMQSEYFIKDGVIIGKEKHWNPKGKPVKSMVYESDDNL